MENWTRLNLTPGKLEDPNPIEGVQIDLYVSPFDIPTHTKGYLDPISGRFVIEFKYIGEEPIGPVGSEGPLHLRLGKNSGRLYAIEVDIDRIGASAVALRLLVDTEMKNLSPTESARENNFDLARQAIHSLADEGLYSAIEPG